MKKKERKPIQTSFMVVDDEKRGQILVEQCYKEGEGCCYATYDGDRVEYVKSISTSDCDYVPIFGEDVTLRVVQLPEKAEDYKNIENLKNEIETFMREWLSVSEEYYPIATYYVIGSWVYDKFDTFNYLRAMGDTGTGKSRFLDVVGGICYKFTLVSGAATPAPVFRMIRRWRGTIGIEEGDLKQTDESNEIIKILNCGFEKGRPVIRCDKNDPSNMEYFDTYCPKVIATRKEFYDKATEARCITEIMEQNDRVKDTKNKRFYRQRQQLINKLLMFRLKNWGCVNVEKANDVNLDFLEPRLRQACRSFIALIIDDEKMMAHFKDYLYRYNREIIEKRSETWEGMVVNDIAQQIITGNTDHLTAKEIADRIGEDKLTYRKVGKIIRAFNLDIIPKKVDGQSKKIIDINIDKLYILFNRYVADDNMKNALKSLDFPVTETVGYRVTEIPNYRGLGDFNNMYDKSTLKYKNMTQKVAKLPKEWLRLPKGVGTHMLGNLGNWVEKKYGNFGNSVVLPKHNIHSIRYVTDNIDKKYTHSGRYVGDKIITKIGQFEKSPDRIFQPCECCGVVFTKGFEWINIKTRKVWCEQCSGIYDEGG